VVEAIEKLQLPGMAIPEGLLASGRKSFTIPPPQKQGEGDATLKSIEVKFYPYPS